MGWHATLTQQWQTLVSQGGGILKVPLPSGQLSADLPTVNAIGCECRSFILTTSRLSGADASKLTAIGNALAQKLNYLMEPVRVIELDGQAQVLQMRSVPPTSQGNTRSYYEVLVQAGGEVSIHRYHAAPGKSRQQVAAIFTHEVFERLVGDILAALP